MAEGPSGPGRRTVHRRPRQGLPLSQEHPRPVPTVGVICFRGEEVLLIRRGKPPRMGDWSVPGGRLEWNEAVQACALRELLEETGVRAELLGLVDVIDGFF